MTNRLQFSEIIPELTESEIEWLIKYVEHRHRKLDIDGNEHEFEDDGYPSFGFKIMTTEEGSYAWFFSEESGSVAQVAETVQEFLREHRPKQCFTLTWAETSTTLKPGEFDGGAAFVTSEEIETFHGVEWARSKEKQFNAA
jgi:hypothetical protein